MTVFTDAPYLRRVQVETDQPALHPHQSVAAFFQHEKTVASRTYIYTSAITLICTAYHDIAAAESRNIDISLAHLSILTAADAVLTDNQNATVRLNHLDDDTLSLIQEELVHPGTVFHRHFLTIAALPEAPLAVFYHLVKIPVT